MGVDSCCCCPFFLFNLHVYNKDGDINVIGDSGYYSPAAVRLAPSFLDIAKDSFRIIVPLKESILSFLQGDGAVEDIRAHAKEIGLLETMVDDKEWALTKAIFISSLDHSYKIHLKHCLDSIVRISDRAEKTAFQVELVTLKLVG